MINWRNWYFRKKSITFLQMTKVISLTKEKLTFFNCSTIVYFRSTSYQLSLGMPLQMKVKKLVVQDHSFSADVNSTHLMLGRSWPEISYSRIVFVSLKSNSCSLMMKLPPRGSKDSVRIRSCLMKKRQLSNLRSYLSARSLTQLLISLRISPANCSNILRSMNSPNFRIKATPLTTVGNVSSFQRAQCFGAQWP